MKRFVWLSDTHLNTVILPFLKQRFIDAIDAQKQLDGVFLTGDISSGLWIEHDLEMLARAVNCPVYFVLGNHDYHRRFISSVRADVSNLCKKISNLRWMTEQDVISINDEVAIIGADGWYDARYGDPKLLKYTTDWLMVLDFYRLSSMDDRVSAFRALAQESAMMIEKRLESALESHKTVYILTHFPPWKEATRAEGTSMEKFWLPYNTNDALGRAIERAAHGRKKKRIVVLAGHTHVACDIRVSNTIECKVSSANYATFLGRHPGQKIFV